MESKYKEITTLKLLLVPASFGGVGYIKEKNKITNQPSSTSPKTKPSREISYLGVGEGVEGGQKWSGSMSGGKPVFVSVMYSPKARMSLGSDHIGASCAREETSFSRRFRAPVRAGQVRTACWKDSGPVWQRGQVGSGFSSDQEGWAAR